MRTADLLHKVTSIEWDDVSPPSTDLIPRRYAPATASATLSGAGAFAHAAKVFGTIPAFSTYAAERKTPLSRHGLAGSHPQAIPSLYNNAGFVTAGAEDCLYGSIDPTNCGHEQYANRVNAAIHLWALTGEQRFADYILQHAETDTPLMKQGDLTHQGMAAESQDALLYYASLPGANATLAGKSALPTKTHCPGNMPGHALPHWHVSRKTGIHTVLIWMNTCGAATIPNPLLGSVCGMSASTVCQSPLRM